ncbi:hypothetical protein GGF32_001115 [Allomyces javanicus]|nr:hypothetical protein GGF32_001115 [Allomyces javanicus]
MDAIAPEFDKFVARHHAYVDKTSAGLDELIATLRTARDQLAGADQDAGAKKAALAMLSLDVKGQTSQIMDATKDISSALAKCGKAIDKKFGTADLEWNPQAFEGKDHLIRQLIGEHFIREGKFELASTFQKESGLSAAPAKNSQFQELNDIIESIRHHDLGPAIEWAESKRFELNRIDSTLQFDLHKQRYLQLLADAGPRSPAVMAAIEYARKYFSQFPACIREIQPLMLAAIYAGQPTAPTTYRTLLARATSPTTWFNLERQFARDFCSLLGLSPDAPLYTAITVGTTALPIIMKMSTIMKEKRNEWTASNELPVEVPLAPRHQFHSVFACPVSREQGTDLNPPMMLPCGHTICNESLKRISKNGSIRFKCPYCPQDTTMAQALRVYL